MIEVSTGYNKIRLARVSFLPHPDGLFPAYCKACRGLTTDTLGIAYEQTVLGENAVVRTGRTSTSPEASLAFLRARAPGELKTTF